MCGSNRWIISFCAPGLNSVVIVLLSKQSSPSSGEMSEAVVNGGKGEICNLFREMNSHEQCASLLWSRPPLPHYTEPCSVLRVRAMQYSDIIASFGGAVLSRHNTHTHTQTLTVCLPAKLFATVVRATSSSIARFMQAIKIARACRNFALHVRLYFSVCGRRCLVECNYRFVLHWPLIGKSVPICKYKQFECARNSNIDDM